MKEYKDWGDQFQTPEDVCEYMSSYIVPERYYDETGEEMTRCNILEPTPGRGNLVKYLVNYGGVFSPMQGTSFFDMEKRRYD